MPTKKVTQIDPKTFTLVDAWVDTPEGTTPEKIHILLNRKVVNFAEQYKRALINVRSIPPNRSTVTAADPIALVYMQNGYKAEEAIRAAIGTYEQWENEADQEAWILALTFDNVFTAEPEPYDPDDSDKPPGVLSFDAPRNLNNGTERRLKQIMDIANSDFEFGRRFMSEINEAIAKAIQLGSETDVAGFRPAKTG